MNRNDIDAIVVISIDRFSRVGAVGTWGLLEGLDQRGIAVHTLDLGPIPVDSFINMIVPLIKADYAKAENAQRVERTMRGKFGKVKSGMIVAPSIPNYGYRRVSADKIEPIEAEAAVVRNIFRWFCIGDETLPGKKRLGAVNIAKRLTDLRIPTRDDGTKRRKKNGPCVWSTSTVYDILRGEIYAGVWQFGKSKLDENGKRVASPKSEWLSAPVPAIIDHELWQKAQDQFATNKKTAHRNATHDYLVGGRIRCGVCGCAMTGIATTYKVNDGSIRTYVYYRCNARKADSRNGEVTCPSCADATKIDRYVWDEIEQALKHPHRIALAINKRRRRLAEGQLPDQRELAQLRIQLENAIDANDRALDLYISGIVKKEDLAERLATLERRRSELSAAINSLEARLAPVDTEPVSAAAMKQWADDILRDIEGMTFQKRRNALARLDISVTVTRLSSGRLDIHIDAEPFGTLSEPSRPWLRTV